MNTIKTAVGWGEGLQRGFDMPLHLGLLTIMAGTGPAGDVPLHIWPDVPFGYEATRGFDARMRQRVQVVKDGSTHR